MKNQFAPKNNLCFILVFFCILLFGCKNFSNSEETNRLYESYINLYEETKFIYEKNFSLNENNIKIIFNNVNDFYKKLNKYKDITKNNDVLFYRLSSDREHIYKLYEITACLYNLLETVKNNPSILENSKEMVNDNFRKIFYDLNNQMYIIGYNKVRISENIISDYVKYFMIFIVFFIILCLILMFIFIFELKQRDSQLHESSKFLDYTLRGQEEEKQHIARELHDTVAQDMRYVIQLTKQLEKTDLQQEVVEKEKECLKQIRELCSSFLPQDIENKDIVSSLSNLLQKIKEEANIDAKLTMVKCDNFNDMSTDRFLHFFRIIQESLTNAKKHSFATEISVLIKKEDIDNEKYIHLIITDDGIGIDPKIIEALNENKTLPTQNHFGLKNITQRVQLLGGKIKITSDKEFGTEINILFKEKDNIVTQ